MNVLSEPITVAVYGIKYARLLAVDTSGDRWEAGCLIATSSGQLQLQKLRELRVQPVPIALFEAVSA